jgi:hypothetical protein
MQSLKPNIRKNSWITAIHFFVVMGIPMASAHSIIVTVASGTTKSSTILQPILALRQRFGIGIMGKFSQKKPNGILNSIRYST